MEIIPLAMAFQFAPWPQPTFRPAQSILRMILGLFIKQLFFIQAIRACRSGYLSVTGIKCLDKLTNNNDIDKPRLCLHVAQTAKICLCLEFLNISLLFPTQMASHLAHSVRELYTIAQAQCNSPKNQDSEFKSTLTFILS